MATRKEVAKKPGRPPAEEESVQITLRFRVSDLEALREEAARRRLPTATFIKQCAFDRMERAARERAKREESK